MKRFYCFDERILIRCWDGMESFSSRTKIQQVTISTKCWEGYTIIGMEAVDMFDIMISIFANAVPGRTV